MYIKVHDHILSCAVFYFTLRPIVQTVQFQILSKMAPVVFILTTKVCITPHIEDWVNFGIITTFLWKYSKTTTFCGNNTLHV